MKTVYEDRDHSARSVATKMRTLSLKSQRTVALVLAILMALTRFHHFGSALSLPDASYAVFFLAGLYVGSRWFWVGLALEAMLIDYVAIHYAGVSGWCVTPAYLFIFPGYAALWVAGRWYGEHVSQSWRSLSLLIVSAGLGTVTSFIVSNAGFYAFSGRFQTLSWSAYSARVAQYLPPYLYSTGGYLAAAVVIHLVVVQWVMPRLAATDHARAGR